MNKRVIAVLGTLILMSALVAGCGPKAKKWTPEQQELVEVFKNLRTAIDKNDKKLWDENVTSAFTVWGVMVTSLDLFNEFVKAAMRDVNKFNRAFDTRYIQEITVSGGSATMVFKDIDQSHKYRFVRQGGKWKWTEMIKMDK